MGAVADWWLLSHHHLRVVQRWHKTSVFGNAPQRRHIGGILAGVAGTCAVPACKCVQYAVIYTLRFGSLGQALMCKKVKIDSCYRAAGMAWRLFMALIGDKGCKKCQLCLGVM